MACSIIRNSKGRVTKVLAKNGQESQLYNQLKSVKGINGKPETALNIYDLTRQDQFKDWFEDSKTVDKNGDPLLLYFDPKTKTFSNDLKHKKAGLPPFYVKVTNMEEGGDGTITTNKDGSVLVTVANTFTQVSLIAPKHGFQSSKPANQLLSRKEKLGKAQATKILNKLSDKFNIKWEFSTEIPGRGQFRDGVVYLNPEKMTADTPFHEFAHPFVYAVYMNNRTLYNNLLKQAKLDSVITQHVNALYTGSNQLERDMEYIVQAIGEYAADAEGLKDKSPSLWDAIKKVLTKIGQYLRRIAKDANKDIKITEMPTNLTLQEMAGLMQLPNKVDFSSTLESYQQRIINGLRGHQRAFITQDRIYVKDHVTGEPKQVHTVRKGEDEATYRRNLEGAVNLSKKTGLFTIKKYKNVYYLDFNNEQIANTVKAEDFIVNKLYNQSWNQLTNREIEFYEKQMQNASLEQKKVIEDVLALQSLVHFDPVAHKYVHIPTGQQFDNVTSILEKELNNKVFTQKGYENKALTYGNMMDSILSSVILGESKAQAISTARQIETNSKAGTSISKENLEIAYDSFAALHTAFPNAIFMTQQIFFNTDKNVAGTVDLLMIEPNGETKIIDLKTSRHDITKSYKAEIKAKHESQLSMYKGLAASKGIAVSELFILPFNIKVENSTGNVTAASMKGFVKANERPEFVSKVKKDSDWKGNQITIEDDSNASYKAIVDKVVKKLGEELEILKSSTVYNTRLKEQRIKELIDEIQAVKSAQAIAIIIDDIYNKLANFDAPFSYVKNVRGIVNRINRGEVKKDPGLLIKDLMDLKAEYDLYMPLVDDLIKVISPSILNLDANHPNTYDNPEKDSPMWKLKKLKEMSTKSLNDLQEVINPAIATILSEEIHNNTEGNFAKELKQNKEILKGLEKRKLENERTGRSNRQVEAQIKRRQKRIQSINDSNPTYENILQELNNGISDVPFLDAWLTPAISSSNNIVALFAKRLKRGFEDAKNRNIRHTQDLVIAFNEYRDANKGVRRDAVAKFNEPFYYMAKDENGNDYMSFVEPIDQTKFRNAEAAVIDKHGKWSDEHKKWLTENTESLPTKDLVVVNPYTKQQVVVQEGTSSIVKNMERDLYATNTDEHAERKLTYFKENNFTRDSKGNYVAKSFKYRVPKQSKYGNKKYQDLMKNKAGKKYYDALISTYFSTQNNLPEGSAMRYRLPSLTKTGNDRVWQNGVKDYVKHAAKSTVQMVGEEGREVYGQTEKGRKVIPVLFSQRMDPKEVSLDLLSSVVRFDGAATRYHEANNLMALGEAILETVQTNSPVKMDSKGEKMLDRFAKKYGITGIEQYAKKHNGNNVATLLEAFIDMQIYGRMQNDESTEILGRTVDFGKLANNLIGFASFTQIGGNPMLSLANSLQARSMALTEAAAGEFFTLKEWRQSYIDYRIKYLPDFISDFNKPMKETVIGQLFDLYDPIQGEYRDKFGRKLSMSAAKKAFSSDSWFFLQYLGEHEVQMRTMLSYMRRVKAKGPKGIQVPLINAYELDANKKLKLKDGYTIDHLGKTDATGLVPVDVQNTLHAINKRLHGVYNDFDKPILERAAVGRLIMMYRKFVVPGLKKRYKKHGFDHELGSFTEGTYRTFARVLVSQFSDMVSFLNPFTPTPSNLTETEIYNLRRSTAEFAMIFLTGMIVMGLVALSLGDDDSDDLWARHLLYSMVRLNSELSFYGGFFNPISDSSSELSAFTPLTMLTPKIGDMFRLLQTPAISYGKIEQFRKILIQAIDDPFEEYQRDAGKFDKGDNKLWAYTQKFLGFTGNNINPEQALKNLERFKNQ